jgi:hypothetical protein
MAEITIDSKAPNGTVGTHTPVVDSSGKVTGATTQGINRATVSEKLAKIGWSNAPLDTMLRNIGKGKTNSDTFEFYSIAARGVECVVKTAVTFNATTMTIALSSGADSLSKSGVLLVPSIKVVNGVAKAATKVTRKPLMLHISDINYATGTATCIPINASSGDTDLKIAASAKLYRAGIACDQDTAITDDPQAMPVKDKNYCQRMLCTISENAYQALQDKDVEFGLADLKEQAIFDFRLQSEAAAIFGGLAVKGENFIDPASMKRKLHMRGVLDFDIQEITGTVSSNDDIDEFLNNAMQQLFSVNNGSEERILLYGAGFATKLANSKWWTKQLEANKTEVKWGVTWKMIESNFGRLRGIMDPALSLMGYEDCALVVDPRHIRVIEQVPMQEHKLDLQKAGIRNSHDIVLEESITLELTNPKAHGLLVLTEA